jgi:hypothetical protein
MYLNDVTSKYSEISIAIKRMQDKLTHLKEQENHIRQVIKSFEEKKGD